MSKTIKTKNIGSLVEAVNQIVIGFLQVQGEANKKLKANVLIEMFKEEELQTKLVEAIQINLPTAPRAPREKKLKDPNAPKRPKSSYLFFCDANRAKIKNENVGINAIETSVKLGKMWQDISDKKKQKFIKMAADAKLQYIEAMNAYVRPSDEELATLPENNRRRRSKNEGKKRKRDPNAPKRPMSAYLYFSREKRSQVKESNPQMSAQDITKELGRLWNDEFKNKKACAKWIKDAENDKARYNDEMKSYIPPIKTENENDTTAPAKKRGRPKGSKAKSSEENDQSNIKSKEIIVGIVQSKSKSVDIENSESKPAVTVRRPTVRTSSDSVPVHVSRESGPMPSDIHLGSVGEWSQYSTPNGSRFFYNPKTRSVQSDIPE